MIPYNLQEKHINYTSYPNSNKHSEIYNVIKTMSELVSQQNSLEQEISAQGDDATNETKAVNVILKATIETTCLWVS